MTLKQNPRFLSPRYNTSRHKHNTTTKEDAQKKEKQPSSSERFYKSFYCPTQVFPQHKKHASVNESRTTRPSTNGNSSTRPQHQISHDTYHTHSSCHTVRFHKVWVPKADCRSTEGTKSFGTPRSFHNKAEHKSAHKPKRVKQHNNKRHPDNTRGLRSNRQGKINRPSSVESIDGVSDITDAPQKFPPPRALAIANEEAFLKARSRRNHNRPASLDQFVAFLARTNKLTERGRFVLVTKDGFIHVSNNQSYIGSVKLINSGWVKAHVAGMKGEQWVTFDNDGLHLLLKSKTFPTIREVLRSDPRSGATNMEYITLWDPIARKTVKISDGFCWLKAVLDRNLPIYRVPQTPLVPKGVLERLVGPLRYLKVGSLLHVSKSGCEIVGSDNSLVGAGHDTLEEEINELQENFLVTDNDDSFVSSILKTLQGYWEIVRDVIIRFLVRISPDLRGSEVAASLKDLIYGDDLSTQMDLNKVDVGKCVDFPEIEEAANEVLLLALRVLQGEDSESELESSSEDPKSITSGLKGGNGGNWFDFILPKQASKSGDCWQRVLWSFLRRFTRKLKNFSNTPLTNLLKTVFSKLIAILSVGWSFVYRTDEQVEEKEGLIDRGSQLIAGVGKKTATFILEHLKKMTMSVTEKILRFVGSLTKESKQTKALKHKIALGFRSLNLSWFQDWLDEDLMKSTLRKVCDKALRCSVQISPYVASIGVGATLLSNTEFRGFVKSKWAQLICWLQTKGAYKLSVDVSKLGLLMVGTLVNNSILSALGGLSRNANVNVFCLGMSLTSVTQAPTSFLTIGTFLINCKTLSQVVKVQRTSTEEGLKKVDIVPHELHLHKEEIFLDTLARFKKNLCRKSVGERGDQFKTQVERVSVSECTDDCEPNKPSLGELEGRNVYERSPVDREKEKLFEAFRQAPTMEIPSTSNRCDDGVDLDQSSGDGNSDPDSRTEFIGKNEDGDTHGEHVEAVTEDSTSELSSQETSSERSSQEDGCGGQKDNQSRAEELKAELLTDPIEVSCESCEVSIPKGYSLLADSFDDSWIDFADKPKGRIACFFSRDGEGYSYTGASHVSKGWDSKLDDLLADCKQQALEYDHCLVQKYSAGTVLPLHADDEDCYDDMTKVLTVNTRGQANFAVKCRGKVSEIDLTNGVWVLMPPGFQRSHKHSVNGFTDGVSFTFRNKRKTERGTVAPARVEKYVSPHKRPGSTSSSSSSSYGVRKEKSKGESSTGVKKSINTPSRSVRVMKQIDEGDVQVVSEGKTTLFLVLQCLGLENFSRYKFEHFLLEHSKIPRKVIPANTTVDIAEFLLYEAKLLNDVADRLLTAVDMGVRRNHKGEQKLSCHAIPTFHSMVLHDSSTPLPERFAEEEKSNILVGSVSGRCVLPLSAVSVHDTESYIYDGKDPVCIGLMKVRGILDVLASTDLTTAEQPTLKFINAVPGGGKTTELIERTAENPEDIIVLTANRGSADEVKEALQKKGIGNFFVRTADSFLIHFTKLQKKIAKRTTLLLDECFMLHRGQVDLILKCANVKEAFLFGDRRQIPFINRATFMNCDFDDVRELQGERIEKVVSYRCPADICWWMSQAKVGKEDLYSSRVLSNQTKKVMKSVDIVPITGKGFSLKERPNAVLTFTQSEKADLLTTRSFMNELGKDAAEKIFTVHEAQGKTFDKVALVRLKPQDDAVFNSSSHKLVALTRHKESLKYYCLRNKVDFGPGKEIALILKVEEHVLRNFQTLRP